MPFTREQLAQMREDRLRTEVLIPLFRAMGFKDVYHYHGGTLEQGKDIVMWKPGELRDRINYAVVVKRGDISGQASGNGSAAEVATQVQQCFGKPYLDFVSAKSCQVDRCWVVTSGRIPKEAINTLDSVLQTNRYINNTEFIDGSRLWELLEKHLPEKAVWELFAQANKIFEEVTPDFKVGVTVDGNATSVTLKPKEGKEIPPFKLRLPEDLSESLKSELQQQIDAFVKTGSPIKLDGSTASFFEFPQGIESLLNVHEGSAYELRQCLNGDSVSIRLIRTCQDGETASLDRLELQCIQGGVEEYTLSNEQQNAPWKFKFVMRRPPASVDVTFAVSIEGANVFEALGWCLFQKACFKAGTLALQNLRTGISVPMRPDQGIGEAVEPQLIELLEKLVFIQNKTHTPIKFTWDFTTEDEYYVHEVYNILKTGYGPSIASANCVLEQAPGIQAKEKLSKPGVFMIKNEKNTRNVFGSQIELGPVEVFGRLVKATDATIQDIDRAIVNGSDDNCIKVQFVSISPDEPITARYTAWASSEDKNP